MAEHEDGQQVESLSIGERLRRGREATGMSLEDVANQTRIPIRHLQHIESEDWDALPAVTYAIGFARNYANAVGLDGAELARELRERIGGTRPRAAPPEYYEMADPARVPPRSLAILAALIAILLVGGYLVWRSTIGGEDAPADAPAAAIRPEPATPPPRAPAASAAGESVVVIAAGDVWLQIDDAGGPALFAGTLRAGERFQIPATAQRPVLRTGRPQLLRAEVGGRDLGPLDPVERTVADLSLRPEDLAARVPAAPAAR